MARRTSISHLSTVVQEETQRTNTRFQLSPRTLPRTVQPSWVAFTAAIVLKIFTNSTTEVEAVAQALIVAIFRE